MKIKYSSIIPFKGFLCINLYGTLYVRKEAKERWESDRFQREETINHELIHEAQARDFCKVLWIGYTIFYLVYFILWLVELLRPPYNSAYKDICFEREANQMNLDYLATRTKFACFTEQYWKNKKN